jgi:hypothetical protein
MDSLELDHYRYLLDKTVTMVRQGKAPDDEVILQYDISLTEDYQIPF